MKEKDNLLKKVVRSQLLVIPVGMLGLWGLTDIFGDLNRMNEKAYNAKPDVAPAAQLAQARAEIAIYNRNVDEQTQRGAKLIDVALAVPPGADIQSDLDLLSQQDKRIEERKNLRSNLRPYDDKKRLLIDLVSVLGTIGFAMWVNVRAGFSRFRPRENQASQS